MKRALRMALVVFVFYILQTSVFTSLRLSTTQPDVMSVMLACLTAYTGYYGAFCAGAMTGLMMDTFVGHIVGLYIVLYPLMAFAAVPLRERMDPLVRRIFRKRLKFGRKYVKSLILCLLMVAFREAIFTIYMFLNGVDLNYTHLLRGVSCVLFSIALVIPCDWLVKRLLLGKPKRPEEEPQS